MMKAAIKDAYLAKLQHTHPTIYQTGSRSLELAELAADRALMGVLRLEGECWSAAVQDVTGWSRWSMAMLAELPD